MVLWAAFIIAGIVYIVFYGGFPLSNRCSPVLY
jgi:hypothetical protein